MTISVAEAIERVLARVSPMPTEEVPLAEAADRVLRADAAATRDQPPFDASAMDGYAVRAAEAREGAVLEVAGESAAGRAYPGALPEGAAVRIFTGAPVPGGADAILIQEDAERNGDRVRVTEAPGAGLYIRPRGMDFTAGFTLEAPRRLAPRDVALIAAMNVARVTVSRRPVIALIPTGDELVEPGETPGPDQIISSNGAGLSALIQSAGAVAKLCPIAPDTREGLTASLEAARGADMIVTLGGASVGDHDLVASVFGEAGLELDFFKVAMRPGKPLMSGTLGGTPMIGLPGNPVSSMVCGEIFLRPAIDRALGLDAGPRRQRTGWLAAPTEANGPREHYMRAVATPGPNGVEEIRPLERQDSNLLATLAEANALLIREPFAPEGNPGDRVSYIPLD